MGEEPSLAVEGLCGDTDYELLARLTDTLGRSWTSLREVRSDSDGRAQLLVNEIVARMAVATPTSEGSMPPVARDFNEIVIHLEGDEVDLRSKRFRQRVIPPGLRRRELA